MELFTDQPGVQFYSGNFLDGTITGKDGSSTASLTRCAWSRISGPTRRTGRISRAARLEPGEVYRHHTVYRFASEEAMMEEVPTSAPSDDPCHLGEGPTYDVATDTAWWFDILEGRLFEAHSAAAAFAFMRWAGWRAHLGGSTPSGS